MRKIIIIFTLFVCSQVTAQYVQSTSIDISIGLGLSTPYDDVDVVDSGFYLQGEYVLGLAKWFSLRPYAGLILTKSNGEDTNQNPTNYKSTSKAFLIGGKARITAPIPWVAPYVEGGIGMSAGSFVTFTPATNIDQSGLILHIPFSFGLEIGTKHTVDIAFTYYFQPSVKQYAGAAALGISIPLHTN